MEIIIETTKEIKINPLTNPDYKHIEIETNVNDFRFNFNSDSEAEDLIYKIIDKYNLTISNLECEECRNKIDDIEKVYCESCYYKLEEENEDLLEQI